MKRGICNCGREYEIRRASWEEPYHYTESGLPNIWLVDVVVYYCDKCKVESAQIPNLEGLHSLIAKDIILTPLPMTGKELRFLRKEAHLKPTELSEMVGVDPKTIANWEKADVLTRQTDLIARVTITATLWKGDEQVGVLTQLAQMVKYAWEPAEPEADEDTEQDFQQLAADNVAYGLNENQEWRMAA